MPNLNQNRIKRRPTASTESILKANSKSPVPLNGSKNILHTYNLGDQTKMNKLVCNSANIFSDSIWKNLAEI